MPKRRGRHISPGPQLQPLDDLVRQQLSGRLLKQKSGPRCTRPSERGHLCPYSSDEVSSLDEMVAREDENEDEGESHAFGEDTLSHQRRDRYDEFGTGECRFVNPDSDPEDDLFGDPDLGLPEGGMQISSFIEHDDIES